MEFRIEKFEGLSLWPKDLEKWFEYRIIMYLYRKLV